MKSPSAAIRDKLAVTNQHLNRALEAAKESIATFEAYVHCILSCALSHAHSPDHSEALLFDCIQMLFKLQIHLFFMVDKKVHQFIDGLLVNVCAQAEVKDNQVALFKIAEVLDWAEKEVLPSLKSKAEADSSDKGRGKKRQVSVL